MFSSCGHFCYKASCFANHLAFTKIIITIFRTMSYMHYICTPWVRIHFFVILRGMSYFAKVSLAYSLMRKKYFVTYAFSIMLVCARRLSKAFHSCVAFEQGVLSAAFEQESSVASRQRSSHRGRFAMLSDAVSAGVRQGWLTCMEASTGRCATWISVCGFEVCGFRYVRSVYSVCLGP